MKKLSIFFIAVIAGLMLFGGSHKLMLDDNNSRVYTFAANDSISSRIDLNGGRLSAIQFPASFTGTQVWVYTSYDSGSTRANLKPVYGFDAATKILIPYVSGAVVGVDPKYSYYTYQHIWLKSLNGTATATQSSARSGRAIITMW